MSKKTCVITFVLFFSIMSGIVGCAGKQVRHLASDVSMVTPGTTTKQEVLNYLGQPDVEYQTDSGETLWVYYNKRKDLLRRTPYIGDMIGKESYEIVRVVFKGDNVEKIAYSTMREDEFKKSGIAQ